jgi:hypothetical protein
MWTRLPNGSVAATARRLLSSTHASSNDGGGRARTLWRAIGVASVALGVTAAALAAADDGDQTPSASATQWAGREIPLDALPSRAELLQRLRASSGGGSGGGGGGRSGDSQHDDAEFDVLVIGGGATGVGVALDAQTRGLRTALVERDDFASGAWR